MGRGMKSRRQNVEEAMNSFVVVSTTVANGRTARRLAELVVKSRLAACAQVFPIHSTYRWKGKVERAPEYAVQTKTRRALAGRLVAFVRAHHAYETPEIVVTPIVDGWKEYLKWIAAETGPVRGK